MKWKLKESFVTWSDRCSRKKIWTLGETPGMCEITEEWLCEDAPRNKPSTRQRLREKAELLAPPSWFLASKTMGKCNSVVHAPGLGDSVMEALADPDTWLKYRDNQVHLHSLPSHWLRVNIFTPRLYFSDTVPLPLTLLKAWTSLWIEIGTWERFYTQLCQNWLVSTREKGDSILPTGPTT